MGAGLEDVAPDRGRADELDGPDIGVLDDRRNSLATAVDDVERAVGAAGLLPQLRLELRGARRVARRLPDHRVAAHERDGVDPHRDHRREVEGRDRGGDAERSPQGLGVDVACDHGRVEAREMAREPAGEVDRLEATEDLAERIGERLAVIPRDQARHLLPVAVHEVAEGEEDLAARDERRVAPGGECRLRSSHGLVDLGLPAARHPGEHLASRRVVDGRGVLGEHFHGRAVDPVGQDRERDRGCCLGPGWQRDRSSQRWFSIPGRLRIVR